MPDIRLYQSANKRHDPFAKFDYMGVLPTLTVLDNFLRVCDECRKSGFKLPKKFLDSERKAYMAIKNEQYVTKGYYWEFVKTDCWVNSPDTWWNDLKTHLGMVEK